MDNTRWRSLLTSRITVVNYKYENGWYVGQKGEGGRDGLGLYYWNNGNIYIGNWQKGERNGMGIYICPDGYSIPNCGKGSIYVGKWENGQKHGKGTVYDKSGKLIYYGDFSYDKPIETYPSQGSYSYYTFDVINYDNGNLYVGETANGKRSGMGFFIWPEGNSNIVWYGPWKDGIRDGYGINIFGQGNESNTGIWKNDTKQ